MSATTTVVNNSSKATANSNLAQPQKRIRYFTPAEIESHNSVTDCWVSVMGRVLDVTPLIAENAGSPLCRPIVNNAGKDISHWFNPNGEVKTYIDPLSNIQAPYVPQGRFLHVPPNSPRSDWATDFEKPWWMDDKYTIGKLSTKTRYIRVFNTLTKEEHMLQVCDEETLGQIQERYSKQFNVHAKGYTWKRIGNILDMSATLESNGIPDEGELMNHVGMNDDEWIPIVHLFFSDDLTVA